MKVIIVPTVLSARRSIHALQERTLAIEISQVPKSALYVHQASLVDGLLDSLLISGLTANQATFVHQELRLLINFRVFQERTHPNRT